MSRAIGAIKSIFQLDGSINSDTLVQYASRYSYPCCGGRPIHRRYMANARLFIMAESRRTYDSNYNRT